MRVWWLLAVAFWGCDDGGGGGGGDAGPGGGGGALTPIEGPAETVGFAATYDRMGRVASVDGFANANIGDPAPYVNSEATTPTDDQALSSLYYETGGFADAIGRTRDRRPGVDKDDNVGDRIQQKVALALTLGFAAEGAASVRNGARWHAQLATRALDQYFLLAAWAGLAERSAAGFDRAVGVLWDASGTPHGIGARIQAADTACGTTHLADIKATLAAVRAPFAAELEASGLPDPLGRLVIAEGALPDYDAARDTVEGHLTAGLGLALVNALKSELDAPAQAAALAAYDALQARARASGVEGIDRVSALLDTSNPSDVDTAEVRRLVSEALDVACP
ncbi:MAG: hypothetical protein R3F60_06520 [bacterium]